VLTNGYRRGATSMRAADTRTSEWGATISAPLVRDFITAWIRHDALLDYVNEHVIDGVQSGDGSAAEIAQALRVAIDEILDTAKPEDWEHIARGLIANAEDALADEAGPPAAIADDQPAIGTDFLPVVQGAKARQRRLTSARIMGAAEALAAEHPGEKTSLLKIAARAEVSLGTVFQRFGDRPGLLAAIQAQRVLQIQKLWAERPSPDASALNQILETADAYLKIALGDPDTFRAITAPHQPAGATGRELTDAVARRIADQNTQVAHAIAQGITDGSIRSVDPEQTATLLWAAWTGILSLASRPDALRATETEIRHQLATATEAILGRATTSPPTRS
jgi:TetR/AcrR family transcriptional regulator